MKPFITVTAALALALAFAGCGDGGSGTAMPGTGVGPTTAAGGTGAASAAPGTGAAAPSGSYTAMDVANGGTINGTVLFDGTPPSLPALPVSKNPEYCGAELANARLTVAETGGVANTVVFLSDITTGAKLEEPPTDAMIDQLKCEYHPHVLVVPAGTQLTIKNSDDILHNVHAYTISGKSIFNFGMPTKDMTIKNKRTTLEESGLYELKCDAGHVWMNAYIFAKEHPYVVKTADDGTFTLTNVPAGTYTLKAWHAGWTAEVTDDGKTINYAEPIEVETKVEVKAGAEATVELKIGGAA